jgi:hypothetical protein
MSCSMVSGFAHRVRGKGWVSMAPNFTVADEVDEVHGAVIAVYHRGKRLH